MIKYFYLTIVLFSSCLLKNKELKQYKGYNFNEADSIFFDFIHVPKGKVFKGKISDIPLNKQKVETIVTLYNKNKYKGFLVFNYKKELILASYPLDSVKNFNNTIISYRKGGRIEYQCNRINHKYEGSFFLYSTNGKLNGIYNMKNDTSINTIYSRKKKFNEFDYKVIRP